MIRRGVCQATTGGLLRRAAFTLMEMLVVVAIIVVLAGVGTVIFIRQRAMISAAKISAAKIRAKEIGNACEMYYRDTGNYPTNLQALLTRDPATKKGPWLNHAEDILSPINGQPFQYDPNGTIGMVGNITVIPDVYTTTPDGQMIGNWKAK
jgi:general secretion pathway protein G